MVLNLAASASLVIWCQSQTQWINVRFDNPTCGDPAHAFLTRGDTDQTLVSACALWERVPDTPRVGSTTWIVRWNAPNAPIRSHRLALVVTDETSAADATVDGQDGWSCAFHDSE